MSSSLAPAVVAPRVTACRTTLTRTADGNATPRVCANGELNVVAWRFYAPFTSVVMSLGQHVTRDQLINAMCSDITLHHATANEVANGATLASIYYG